MPIDYDCSCGRHVQFEDHQAGRRCRCRSCGAAYTVPVFVPVPSRARGLVSTLRGPIGVGLLLGVLVLLGLGWSTGNLPSPSLPAWQAAHEVPTADWHDTGSPDEKLRQLLQLLEGWCLTFVAFSVVPFALPIVLSRRGYLSVARWALLCPALLFTALPLLVVSALCAVEPNLKGIAFVFAIPLQPLFYGSVGSLFAAVVYPRRRR
jgi:hypothetical protein